MKEPFHKTAFDALAIGVLSAALTAASGGRWIHWLFLNLSLGWLLGRLMPR